MTRCASAIVILRRPRQAEQVGSQIEILGHGTGTTVADVEHLAGRAPFGGRADRPSPGRRHGCGWSAEIPPRSAPAAPAAGGPTAADPAHRCRSPAGSRPARPARAPHPFRTVSASRRRLRPAGLRIDRRRLGHPFPTTVSVHAAGAEVDDLDRSLRPADRRAKVTHTGVPWAATGWGGHVVEPFAGQRQCGQRTWVIEVAADWLDIESAESVGPGIATDQAGTPAVLVPARGAPRARRYRRNR